MNAMAVFFGALFFAIGLSAGNIAESRPNLKNAMAVNKDSAENADYNKISTLLDSMNFVLEADFLANKYGYQIPVSSSLNFIKVDSMNAVLQTGNNISLGYNGVGGVTAEGNISNWKLTKDEKRKTFYVSMNVNTNIGWYNLFMNVSASGRATATITGLWPGKLTWDGYIVPNEETRTFQGSTY